MGGGECGWIPHLLVLTYRTMDYIALKALANLCRERFSGRKVKSFRLAAPRVVSVELSGGAALLLSAAPERAGLIPLPRDHNPDGGEEDRGGSASPFITVLNSRLAGTVLADISLPQPGERVVSVVFGHGWPATRDTRSTLVCEFMGRRSNLIMVDRDERVLAAARTVPPGRSRVRPVVPGHILAPLPPRPGVPVDLVSAGDLADGAVRSEGELMAAVSGLSPWTAGQVLALAGGLDPTALAGAIGGMLNATGEGFITVSGHRCFISPFPPADPEGTATVTACPDLAEAAFKWFQLRGAGNETSKQEAGLKGRLARLRGDRERLLDRLLTEEERCRPFGEVRRRGEALLAGFASVEKGKQRVCLADPYQPERTLDIELDPGKSPQENAAAYFDRARKMERGLSELPGRMHEVQREIEAADAAAAALADGDPGPAEKLLNTGENAGDGGGAPTAWRGPGRRYVKDGFTMLVGRNAADNEKVTFRAAGNTDIWLHTRDYAGSHVVILAGRRQVPEEVIRYAASLASASSQAGGDPSIEVMVAERKWVRKLKGGKPGQVTVERYRTVRPLVQ